MIIEHKTTMYKNNRARDHDDALLGEHGIVTPEYRAVSTRSVVATRHVGRANGLARDGEFLRAKAVVSRDSSWHWPPREGRCRYLAVSNGQLPKVKAVIRWDLSWRWLRIRGHCPYLAVVGGQLTPECERWVARTLSWLGGGEGVLRFHGVLIGVYTSLEDVVRRGWSHWKPVNIRKVSQRVVVHTGPKRVGQRVCLAPLH